MALWNKVILSGSNAELRSLYVQTAVTASIISASQYIGSIESASYALSASYAPGGNSLTSSYALTASYIDLAGNLSYIHSQSIAATTWPVTHSLNTEYLNVTVWSASKVVIPEEITSTGLNTMEITFPSSQVGIVAVGRGSFTQTTVTSASYALSASYAPGAAGVAGPNESIQFNDSGVTSGSSTFGFKKSTNVVELTGSMVIGEVSSISGSSDFNLNVGSFNRVDGRFGIVTGQLNEIFGTTNRGSAIIGGEYNIINASNSGRNVIVGGISNTIGNNAESTLIAASENCQIGDSNSYQSAIIAGSGVSISGSQYSLASGLDNIIKQGTYASNAFGYGSIVSGSTQFVIGKYNKRGNSDALFIIGSGSGNTDAQRQDLAIFTPGSIQLNAGVTGSFSGSFEGNGSGLTNVVSSSYALSASYAPSNGVTDHGALTGLLDNDHPQYVLNSITSSMSVATASYAVTSSYYRETKTFGITIDGGGSVITTGVKSDLIVPFPCTIDSWYLTADQAGSIVIDVWKDTLANFPPTVVDTIAGTEKPTLTGVAFNSDTSLTTFTGSLVTNDVLRFNVDSVATVTRVTLTFKAFI